MPWRDLPLRAKVIGLAALAAGGGFAAGLLPATLHTDPWVAPCVLTLFIMILVAVIGPSLWRPYAQLLIAIHGDERAGEDAPQRELPAEMRLRRDEAGRLARAFERLSLRAKRHHREAHLIRRTLDVRVEAETEKAIRKLKRMAMRDALTDLGNRHFLEESLEPLVESVKASDTDLICLVIDVDNFKKLNDTMGHAAGDDLLVLLGDLLRGSIRREDFAVRLGGDEFVILLPSCELSRARVLAQHLGDLFRQHTRTTLPANLPVSLSIGISSMKQDRADSGNELLASADRKLYAAKRAGKAQSVSA